MFDNPSTAPPSLEDLIADNNTMTPFDIKAGGTPHDVTVTVPKGKLAQFYKEGFDAWQWFNNLTERN